MNHGEGFEIPAEALLSDDPDLWLVGADMKAWSEAHPCECEGVCECE